jgi:UDP-glucose 4-epimerase
MDAIRGDVTAIGAEFRGCMSADKNTLEGLRVTLTGATGFIGSALLPRLLAARAQVVGLSRRLDNSVLPSQRGLTWAYWDLENPESAHSALRDTDCICHLAAYIPEDMDDPTEAGPCLRINALGTLGLLEAAKAAGIGHFVNVSSGQVYARQERPVRETDPAHPSFRATYYLSSKLTGEMYVDHYGDTDTFATANLRLGSVYGPGMNPATTMYKLIRSAMHGRPIRLTGMGQYSVDLVFVEDVVSVVLCVLQKRAMGTFNVGSGEATSIEALAREIVRQCGADPRSIEYGPDVPADAGFFPLNIEKARRVLGYSPTPLVEGLESTISAVSSNERAEAMAPDPGWQK